MNSPSARDMTGSLFPELADNAPSQHADTDGRPGATDAPAGTAVPVETSPATQEDIENLRGALRSALEPEQYQTWFQRSKLLGYEDGTAVIAVPNSFARNWIERYYMEALENCVDAVLPSPIEGGSRPVVLREQPEALVDTQPSAPPLLDASSQPESGFERGLRESSRTDSGSESQSRGFNRQTDRTPFPKGKGRLTRDVNAARAESGLLPSRKGKSGGPSSSQQRVSKGWSPLDEGSDFVLNPKCTFDNFVVGPCNRFGHAASLGASEQPGTSYNPLFLYGRVGVGKTHLLQAFCFSVLDRFPESRILYLSCETFVNHFIGALEDGDMMTFRDKYRNIDVLVVDDVQLLANKERTQEEFFHTFNSLYNAGKQIVLSSDSPPKDIPTLQDRLISRFKWGMVTEIEPPCYETRMAIVKRKARERGAELPDDVAQFIAENIEENVRELEGAVTRLFGYTALTNSELTLDLARESLAGLIDVRRGAPTVDEIISIVTDHYQVKLSELQSKRRTKTIAFPRQVAMYLARKVTRHSLEEIGGFFGGRDHTTVLYAVDKIEKLIVSDANFSRQIKKFMERLVSR